MAANIRKEGKELLREPLLNKGTAFSVKERDIFKLHGLLPSKVETLEEQLLRCRGSFDAKEAPLEQHIYLRALQDRNEVLFYRFILDNLEEMMPIIYTPVVGEACQFFHHIYRQPRGLFISYHEAEKMDDIFASIAATQEVKVIVVTDGERILGLGDQGVGGLGIPIGKLSLYTACGGVDPANTLPIVLDVGTNNQERLDDPEYFGWRHTRLTGEEYNRFVDQFVQSVKKHFPNVLLQFEDFAQQHAYPLLNRYQDQLCTFNDDIQGTAAVTVAAILAAASTSGIPLKDHRVAVLGAGSAGSGISEQLVQAMVQQGVNEKEARSHFFLVDRMGLIHDGQADLLPFQQPFAQSREAISQWKLKNPAQINLIDVVENAKPTILLGVSGQPNQFTKEMIEKMSEYCVRPIIFPLSNPTSRAEANPNDLLHWSNGKALVATGSPFDAVQINGRDIPIAQCNNSYIFPGVGLAVIAGKIKRVTNKMMMAAAIALSELAPATKTGEGRLLPELKTIREVSLHIAKKVVTEAIKEGHSELSEKDIEQAVKANMWSPTYQNLA
ncbi:malate dehydrogenase (plasmid) [Legionella adelaidensis]|uniref:Malolactic enzyme n=1 Tax=Legionella adelaidensis TaxID=45056 RepID=A0A0W0R6E7_9GAMM|nr:NAD-dependent malic enzyme [Legionella adelaidensis]KTC66604.1 malate dehydrogenase [Legionella adelaidensis]VEH85511.1 malate dehydrogenase [Legionella adelaidensis]